MPNSDMSIVHLLAPAEVGGLERVVQGLAIGQHRRGYEVHVITVITPGTNITPFAGRLIQEGIPVEVIEIPARGYIKERRIIRVKLIDISPGVLHTHGYRPDVLDAPIARKLGIASVTTLHGTSRLGGTSIISEWIQRRMLRYFDAVIAVSQPIADELPLLGVKRNRIHFIPNAWEGEVSSLYSREQARDILSLPHDNLVIGWVGRLAHVKGGDIFLKSMARMDPEMNISAIIIGDGPERNNLEELAGKLGVLHRVRFQGLMHDARRYFRAFDMFVLSSRSEGIPIVLFEAMASEIPVISTRVGGVPYVLGEKGGMIIPEGDYKQLAHAIEVLVNDPQMGINCIENASQRLNEEFSMIKWIDRHDSVYHKIIHAH